MPPIDPSSDSDQPAARQPTPPPLSSPVTDAQLHLRVALHPSLGPPLRRPLSAYTHLLNVCLDPSLHTRSISLTPEHAELAPAPIPAPAPAPAITSPHEPTQPTPALPAQPPSHTAHSLGEHALENCVPPVESRPPRSSPKPSAETAPHSVRQPYRVPASTDIDTLDRLSPRPAKPSALAQIKPWRTFTPLPGSPLYTLPPRSPADAHRRGFWFIPVWKRRVGPDDFFATFADAVSLPSWARPPLSHMDPALKGYTQPPVQWTPARLRAFWKIIAHICNRGTIGSISAVAVISSHAQDTLPTPSSLDPPPTSTSRPAPEAASAAPSVEDEFGDHIRVWSDLDSALQVRRLFSDLSLSLVPPAALDDSSSSSAASETPVSEEEARCKWLRKCVFMWFDDAGQPRGFG